MPEVPPTTTAVRPARERVTWTICPSQCSAREAERFLCRLAPDSLRRQALADSPRGAERAASWLEAKARAEAHQPWSRPAQIGAQRGGDLAERRGAEVTARVGEVRRVRH